MIKALFMVKPAGKCALAFPRRAEKETPVSDRGVLFRFNSGACAIDVIP